MPPRSGLDQNPIILGSSLFIAVFSPASLFCLNRKTGKILWKKSFKGFIGSPIKIHRGILYAITSTTIHAIHIKTGTSVWRHKPYGDIGEWIYSGLSFLGRRIYYGDRAGFFQCLDYKTGQIVWRVKASDSQINATAFVNKSHVIFATNNCEVVALDSTLGIEKWRTKVDGPSTLEVIGFQKYIVVAADSLYFLNPKNGMILKRYFWKKSKVRLVFSNIKKIAVLVHHPKKDEIPDLIFEVDVNKKFKPKKLSDWTTGISISRGGKLLFISGYGEIEIYLRKNLTKLGKILCPTHGYCGAPSVDKKTIYHLTGDGAVVALKHPLSTFGI